MSDLPWSLNVGFWSFLPFTHRPAEIAVVSDAGMEHSIRMKGRYASAMESPEKLLLTALVISLLVHLLTFGVWKLGQSLGWWRHLGLPRWMLLVKKGAAAPLKNVPLKVPAPQEPALVFVDVDPALAVAEPPKNPKFYSSANSLASNPTKKLDSDMPQVDGRQTVVIKTTEPAKPKAQPLQPSPPTPEKTEIAPAKPLPKPSSTPGDLAMVKPQEKTVDTKVQDQTQTADAAESEPRPRPRSLAEAHERQGLQGEPMRQEGGVNKIAPASLDAVGTPWGDYDRDFIRAVQISWDELLRNQTASPGNVRLEFKMHHDGRITDMKVAGSTVNELQELLCQRAVQLQDPFRRWPAKMRQELTDPRDVVFTFYYLSY